LSTDIPAKSPTVVFKEMDEGGVLFCSRTETYFGLNEVGVAIWERLPGAEEAESRELDSLLDTLQEVYPGVARDALASDVQEFLQALEQSELVLYGQPGQA